MARLRLVHREDCGLCDEMAEALGALAAERALPAIERVDVDSDPALARRYGLKVPVLLLDDAPVCHGRLDGAELLRLLALR
jgi:thiol-disulfide isomerase/thioredoxin